MRYLAALLRRSEMTPRARAYLWIAASRHLTLGASCLLLADGFTTTSMAQIRDVMSLHVWGSLFVIVGTGCALASFRQSEHLARIALVLSAATSATWMAGFLAAALQHQLTNPALPILAGALAAKDLVVCAQPLRSPFERLGRELP